jgi:hypothetical protein
MSKHCCDRMEHDLDQTCDLHPDRFDCADALIGIVNGEYGIIVHDGGSSVVRIAYCPWCGSKLPTEEGSDRKSQDDEEFSF